MYSYNKFRCKTYNSKGIFIYFQISALQIGNLQYNTAAI